MLNEILTTVGFDEKSEVLGFKCTVLGKYGVYIEGARRIVKFEGDEVTVETVCGQVHIAGENLTLRSMTKTDVVVGGHIANIEFTKKD